MNFTRTLIITALVAAASPAFAQATINNTKALAGNVTPGDAAGYPVTISQPGSYKLTGNLSVPAGVNGIEIKADGVTLDLNGFKISGTGLCTFSDSTWSVTCVGGTGYGVQASVDGMSSTVIRNGTVQGFWTGILLGNGRAESLTVRHNAYIGLEADGDNIGSAVTGIHAELNGTGIHIHRGSIERSFAFLNTYGMKGNSFQNASAANSQAMRNKVGMSNVGLHDSRSTTNQTDLSGTAAY